MEHVTPEMSARCAAKVSDELCPFEEDSPIEAEVGGRGATHIPLRRWCRVFCWMLERLGSFVARC